MIFHILIIELIIISGNINQRVINIVDCGGNLSNIEESSGIIQSENFPIKYDSPVAGKATRSCNWYITVKPSHQILFNVLTFVLEGNPAGILNSILFVNSMGTRNLLILEI